MEMKLKIVEGSPETIFAKVHRNARSDWYMKKHLPRRPPPFPGPNARPGLTPQEPLALTEEVAASYCTFFSGKKAENAEGLGLFGNNKND